MDTQQIYDPSCFGIQSAFGEFFRDFFAMFYFAAHGPNLSYLPCLDTRHPTIGTASTAMSLPSLVFSTASLGQQATGQAYLNPLQGNF